MAVTRPSVNFSTRQVVYHRESTKPYVGFQNEGDLPGGWQFDIKRWCSPFDLRLPNLPRLADQSTQGVSESQYFKSGVGSVKDGDVCVSSINELFRDHERSWIPIIRHGQYYRYKTPWHLYGDNSRVQYVDSANNRSGRNYVELTVEPDMSSPILAASFRRPSNTQTPAYYIFVNQTYEFSGSFVSEVEQETVSAAGKIDWSNVDINKKEFIVDNTIDETTALIFNRNYIETVGVVPTVYQDLAASEVLGLSSGSAYQVFRLSRFPVLADSSFHLYVADVSTWVEWTRVDTWFELLNSTAQTRYFVDKDLGIVYLGSSANGGIPPLGTSIVASYSVTLRIEYEEAERDTSISAWLADVSPVTQNINQGFVCITHDQLEAAIITLNIDKAMVPFTSSPREYGPIYAGADYAVLKATVTSISGVPVPGIEVGFTMSPSDIGYLSGASVSSSVSTGDGEAFTSYQPPTSADDLGFYTTIVRASTNPYYPAHKDVIINMTETGLEGKESEVYLYQILKDDVLLGYDTLDDWISYNLDTPAWVTDATTYAQWKSEITIENDLKEWEGVQADGSIVGRKVVTYMLDSTTENTDAAARHPATGDLGAVVPVRPLLVEQIDDATDAYNGKWRAIYPEDAVPDCSPTDSDNNVGGYWLISTRLVTFQAHCVSPYYNRVIYSNEMVARVSLPDYLLGEYVNDYLEKVPFGWKIATDTDNVAAGIDGATFITVNPHSGPYRIVDLVNSTTSTEWADAPFRSLGFQFGFAPLWLASTSYSIGDFVLSTADGLYECTTAGTSNIAEPTWDTDTGDTTADNTAVWTKV